MNLTEEEIAARERALALYGCTLSHEQLVEQAAMLVAARRALALWVLGGRVEPWGMRPTAQRKPEPAHFFERKPPGGALHTDFPPAAFAAMRR